jgi:hypothetical protein
MSVQSFTKLSELQSQICIIVSHTTTSRILYFADFLLLDNLYKLSHCSHEGIQIQNKKILKALLITLW